MHITYLCTQYEYVLLLTLSNFMAQYIKKEIVDLNSSGSTKAYYKLKTLRRLEFDEFVKRCHSFNGAYSRGLLKGVMTAFCEHLSYEISNGYSVKIDGLGVFTAKLGVRKDKEMDGFEEGTAKRNSKSIEVTGILFKADKKLIREIDRNCNLERAGEERLKKSKLSKEERIERARQFMKNNTYMRVDEYASITGLAYSTAARELCSIASDSSSGIISQGRKSGKLYLLAKQA